MGWDFKMKKTSFFYNGGLLSNLKSESFSLSTLIDWQDMGDMASLSSGNAKALKKVTGIKNWVAFCKILVEAIFIILEEDPEDWCESEKQKKVVATKKKAQKKNILLDSDSDADFLPKEYVPPPPKTIQQPKRIQKAVKKTSVVPKLKKPESERGGADYNLQMGLALSISAEEVKNYQKTKQANTNLHCYFLK